MARRPLDAYFTPRWQTEALLARVPVTGIVLEPCAGDYSIVNVINERGAVTSILTNDVGRQHLYDWTLDATRPDLYRVAAPVDWIVTNPPYKSPDCLAIVQRSVDTARVGVAMLLRLSFLEPTDTRNPRGPWLAAHPPDGLLVLPRHSYTGDGRSDSVTTAWVVWYRANRSKYRPIQCLHGADALEVHA